ncbi:MAG: ABC transporter ATP-binding protein [Spirochaetales bacterium]|nr:ABC transporter ATP-binding protein [Spirochaetales bacterium]
MIEAANLVKRYGPHTAVDHANFRIENGEIVGFLGPNGAGKSTTMNILTGYLSSTEGTVSVDGLDILEHPIEAKKKIGYLPENPPLYPEMTVREYLFFAGEIKKVPSGVLRGRMARVMETVGVQDVSGRLIKNLSKGYRQRVGLAQAMIGDPEILILDEPTAGLDPKQILEIRDLITRLGQDHTIILSSHILPEVSAVCRRVLIINQGVIVADDTPDNLAKRLLGGSHIILRLDAGEGAVSDVLAKIAGISGREFREPQEAGTVELVLEAAGDVDIRRDIFRAFSAADIPILMMRSLDMSLEDIFLHVTTTDAAAADAAAIDSAAAAEADHVSTGDGSDNSDSSAGNSSGEEGK